MRFFICITAVLGVACAALGANGAEPLSVYANASLGQNFMGGFDYLPDGDIIGMYTDPNMVENAYIGVIDANGDGVPTGVNRVHEFNAPTFGIAVKVSPDGSRVLFGDSFTFQLFSMNLADYGDVAEIVPTGATFQGAYDIASIDAGHCYVNASPGAFPATTNRIFHLDLGSGALTELVSIDGTYAGPIDTDDDGNLYYVKGKANFPVQPGDFTLLRFTASALQNALASAIVLEESDAEIIAGGLDGGQDVAWHSSGALFVADANNDAIYEAAPGGILSDYTVVPGESGEGFWFLAVYRRNLPLRASAAGTAEIAATYQPLPGAGEPDLMRVSPQVNVGERLLLTAAISEPVPVAFDAYVVLSGPGGILYSALPGDGIGEGIRAYAPGIPGLAQEFLGRVLEIEVPEGAPQGAWTVYAGLMPAGKAPSPAAALALDTVELTVR